jgi:hypothetical protein
MSYPLDELIAESSRDLEVPRHEKLLRSLPAYEPCLLAHLILTSDQRGRNGDEEVLVYRAGFLRSRKEIVSGSTGTGKASSTSWPSTLTTAASSWSLQVSVSQSRSNDFSSLRIREPTSLPGSLPGERHKQARSTTEPNQDHGRDRQRND